MPEAPAARRWRRPAFCPSQCVRSGDAEQRALRIPRDREADLVGKSLGGQLDRVTVVQDRFHNRGREEAEAQDAREVRATHTGVSGKLL